MATTVANRVSNKNVYSYAAGKWCDANGGRDPGGGMGPADQSVLAEGPWTAGSGEHAMQALFGGVSRMAEPDRLYDRAARS